MGGNTKAVSSPLGAANQSQDYRQQDDDTAGALAHAWFIWEKGFHGEPVLRWFHT